MNMNQGLKVFKNLLAEILNYLVFWAAGSIVLTDFLPFHISWLWLWAPGFLALFYYALRERCRRFWVFLLLHILPIGGFWVLYKGNIFQKLWVLAVMVILAMMSFSKKLHSREMGYEVIQPVVFTGLLCVLYLIDKKQSGGAGTGLLLYTLIGFVMGYLGHYFLGQFLRYIEVNNRTTENIPVGHVFRSSAGLAGGFTALAGIIMLFGADRELLERIGAAIHQAFISLLRFLFSLLPRGTEGTEEMEMVLPQESLPLMQLDEMEATEPSLFMRIMEILFSAVAVGVIVTLLFIALVRLIKWIRDAFSGRKEAAESTGEIHGDLVEKLEKQEDKDREKNKMTIWQRAQRALSPEERIRRIYKKAIEKGLSSLEEKRKGELTGARTPREWCVRLFPEQEQKALEFAGLYEKARYGLRLCDAEDVKRARKLAEEFHR